MVRRVATPALLSPSRGTTRGVAWVLGISLVLGGWLAPPAATAADVDEVRLPLPTYIGAGDLQAVSGSSLLVWSPKDEGTFYLSSGGAWREVDYPYPHRPGPTEEGNTYYLGGDVLVQAFGNRIQRFNLVTGKLDLYSVTDDQQVWGANSRVRVYWEPAHQEDFWVQAISGSGEPTALQRQPRLPDPSYYEGTDTIGSWVTDKTWTRSIPFWGVRGGTEFYKSRVYTYALDGTGAWSFPMDGQLLSVLGNPGGAENKLRYLTRDGKVLKDCTRTGTAGPSCTTIPKSATGDVWVTVFGDVVGLTFGATEYLWEKKKLTKVSVPSGVMEARFEGPGDKTRPVLAVFRENAIDAVGDYYTVSSAGKLTKLIGDVPGETHVATEMVDRGSKYLVGLDDRDGNDDWIAHRAWVRTLGADGVGSEKTLSTRAQGVLTSGSRYVVNGEDGLDFYDKGKKVKDTGKVHLLAGASGPYVLVQPKSTAGSYELRTANGTVATGLKNVIGQFGSLVATFDPSTDRIRVKDYADPASSWTVQAPEADGELILTELWGDWIALSYATFDGAQFDFVGWQTHFLNYRSGSATDPYAGRIDSLGDGVAVVWNESEDRYYLWDHTAGTAQAPLDDEVWSWSALDDANGLAYTTKSELVVRTLEAAGESPPRVLGALADSGCNALDCAWKLAIDATKALGAGTLTITQQAADGAGATRTIPVPGAPDGSLRLLWDGTISGVLDTPEAVYAPAGTYDWVFTAEASDGTGTLVGLNGESAVAGQITVTRSPVAFPQATPKISDSTPVTGQLLSADPGGNIPAEATARVAHQWYRVNSKGVSTAIGGATRKDYRVTASDVGLKLKVKVTVPATQRYQSSSKYSATTSTVAKANLPAPQLKPLATPQVDVTLAMVASGWNSSVTDKIAYQWYRVKGSKTTAISKATRSEYTPKGSDKGYRLKVKLTASKAGYNSKSITSPLTAAARAGAYSVAPDSQLVGTFRVGMKVTVRNGAFADADGTPVTPSFSYQWYRVDAVSGKATAISKATKSSYTATAADQGRILKAKVKVKRSGYPTLSRLALGSARVAPGITGVTPKLNSTKPKVGTELVADPGAWRPDEVSLAYQWYRGSKAISGATSATYKVTSADYRQKLRVKVTGSAPDHVSVVKYSAYTTAVAVGAFTNQAPPVVQRGADPVTAVAVGDELKVTKGTWTPAPAKYTYQWYRVDAAGKALAVAGATTSTYTVTAADAGGSILAKVTVAANGVTTRSVSSASVTVTT